MFTPRKIADNYRELVSSIGFYPSLLSVIFLLFAVLVTTTEYTSFVMELKSLLEVLLVDSEENARTILSTLTGSIISLTVFSFSMVMVVLNSASASLSPRVLPGLITRKSHQLVLGFYLGSIIFSIVMLINIRTMDNGEIGIPSLGILFALVFGLISLGFFVFFIHSISRAIQVDNVLNDLYKNTKNELKSIISMQKDNPIDVFPNFDDWSSISSKTEGYFKGVNSDKLCALCQQHDIKIYVVVKQGFFTVEGYPFLKCNHDLSDNEQLLEDLLNCFIFYIEEYVSDNYRFGMTQISEIAVKAMSPGINDPGTAVKAIDMLSILLIDRLSIYNVNYSFKHSDNKQPLLYFHETSFDELLHDNFTPIRNYAKSDGYVMNNVLEAFKNILFRTHQNSKAAQSLFTYLDAIIDDINEHISNQYDREQISNMLNAIARISPEMGEQLVAKFRHQ
ncbi:DUF2254 domain-containing protein [Pseudoalteromonas ostreae]|uniref:DUF2254 domain-containing protein n=1 Tax=Pseudoalteromonas ostreae TaxID=2774154 RepID=UPI001B369806|nr:DUF2254 domain-containing protein [Pseudoalteromonas ostreae]